MIRITVWNTHTKRGRIFFRPFEHEAHPDKRKRVDNIWTPQQLNSSGGAKGEFGLSHQGALVDERVVQERNLRLALTIGQPNLAHCETNWPPSGNVELYSFPFYIFSSVDASLLR